MSYFTPIPSYGLKKQNFFFNSDNEGIRCQKTIEAVKWVKDHHKMEIVAQREREGERERKTERQREGREGE